MQSSAPVFKARIAGTRLEVHPRWSRSTFAATRELTCSSPTGVAGLGGERCGSGQSGSSSRGSHAPPGSARKSRTGQRATGDVVSDGVSTEVRGLMGDPQRELEHLRKLCHSVDDTSLESRMQRRVACPVRRALDGNGPQQCDTAPSFDPIFTMGAADKAANLGG